MKKIYFFYPKAVKITGQEMASKLILQLLPEINFKVAFFPAYDRNKGKIYALFYIFKIFLSWSRVFLLFFAHKPLVYVNLGQGRMSLWRDGQPFKILSWFKKYSMVISLHGHLFTTWNGNEKDCRLFVSILQKARFITVLGEVQKQKLISLGIAPEKILIIPNTCEIALDKNLQKLPEMHLLYLSNLIEDKGYMEYLQGLKNLSGKNLSRKINAVLCGDLYEGELNKSAEIEQILSEINSSSNVTIRWIKGAYGQEKELLFKKTDIFVFPSKYKVEAQPIVLLEAMATSCAIITTKVGEIPSTVSPEVAVLLEKPLPELISSEIFTLTENEELLRKMQKSSFSRFEKYFSSDVYKNNWQKIFEDL